MRGDSMKLVGTLEQNIYIPTSIVYMNDFKDEFVDKLLKIRDEVEDRYGVLPTLAMSQNTFAWFKRLFKADSTWIETIDRTSFWLMNIVTLDMRNGLFDFYVEDDR